jgi:CheY-like chemotaxis protein
MTKILLVEDDKSLREIYGVRLLAEGYDIISAGDGEAALAMAIKERPLLIVSDVMMPKISGFDMLDILRSTTETKDIKVIMMTALSSEDQRARGEALGADRYLVKSQVGIEDVVRTVHDVLGDAPLSPVSAAQTFGSLSSPRPTQTLPPRPMVQQPQPMMPPQAAVAPPTQQFAATAQPFQPQVQPRLQPVPPMQPAGLPQPTAPFSTNRPASLGQRTIHPIAPTSANGTGSDIGSLMAQELSRAAPQPAPMPAPAPMNPLPPPPPAPTMPTQQPQQQQTMAAQAPTPAPVYSAPSQPTAPVAPDEPSGITFEETPRQPTQTPVQPAQQFSQPQPSNGPQLGNQPPQV